MKRTLDIFFLSATAVLALATAGCQSNHHSPTINASLSRQRNEGYSLLYKLMSDESDVGKIFILKKAEKSVKALVEEVGTTCQSAKKQMDAFPKDQGQVHFDVGDLPYVEQKGRDLQAKEDEKRLLLSSGKEFEVRLVFTQAQATDYAKQLCAALLEKEDDAVRKTFLQGLEKRCADLHDRLMKLLSV
jgi:hypothetical protein